MTFYDYICTNGHETRAGASAKYCAICGAEMERQKLGLTDHQRWVLTEGRNDGDYAISRRLP